MLETGQLLDTARERTGLSDYGDEWFVEPLGWLVDSINTESRLTETGNAVIPEMLLAHLVNHLELEDWYKRHPEIEDEQIVAPLFGLGLPRTGSTAFGHMMGLDPGTRVLRVWEQERHCPPPEKATEDTDPRIAISAAGEDAFQSVVPEVTNLLPRGVTKGTECAFPLAECFSSGPTYDLFVHVPTYSQRTTADDYDMERAYRYHQRVLKLLQWRCPPKRWFLRTPLHTYDIEALLKVYPDANFIWTHRDPLRSISSVCSLIQHYRHAFIENTEPKYVGHDHVHFWPRALKRSMDARARLGEGRFFDVYHKRQIVDPKAQVRAAYAHFGWDYPAEMDRWIGDWQEEHPKGKHESNLETFGLDPVEVAEAFRFYTDRFDV